MEKGTYIITSAQAQAKPHTKFLKSLEEYSPLELIILPMIGKDAKEDLDQLHPSFSNVEYGVRKLNENIQIEQFNIRPYQIDPIVGLNRFAQRGQSLILASPKQRLRTIPHSNHKLPKYLLTTGACTHPNYATEMDVSAERRRLGSVATRDHIYGALIVEVVDDKNYHIRHIKANNDGEFVDLGTRYTPNGNKPSRLEAMVLGDWHSGQTDPQVLQATINMIDDLKPKKLILHDFFDGHSVSHHIDKKPVKEKLIHVYDKGLFSLENELKLCYDELCMLSKMTPEVYVVLSNHLEFLDRYLEEYRYTKDVHNFRLSVKLLDYMATKDYNNPVEAGIKMMGKLPKNVKFLRRDDDLKVRGYQLGNHGDTGPSGGRGTMISKENDFGKSITGHVHKAQILRDTYTVGTMLPFNQFYIRGQPNDWTHTHACVWDNGSVQLVNIINGKYRN